MLKRQLSLGDDNPPIAIDGDAIKVMNLAGVLRMSPQVEIDLAPKFLGHHYSGWREDFLAISNLTGHGRIFSGERVSAIYGQSADLASLIGRNFVREYRSNSRSGLRTYRQRKWRDADLVGSLDTDGLAQVGKDGFLQTSTVLDGFNPFNGVIRAAAEALLGEVRDPIVRNQIAQIHRELPPQGPSPNRLPRLPGRNRHWQPLIELSLEVLKGFDVRLEEGQVAAPGFLVRTWQAWERLVFLALRLERGDNRTAFQMEHAWAMRGDSPLFVKPDVTLDPETIAAPVDAKYKTRLDKRNLKITQTDLMEVSAFMEATHSNATVLLYPRLAIEGEAPVACGTCRAFDQVEIGERTVIALDVEVRGIGERGGYETFARGLSAGVEHHHPSLGATTQT
jgi:5-methylcytosine-specific restriction endonuclease McrBC regulatory subunit McrC